MNDVLNKAQLGVVADITMGQSPDSSSYNSDEIGLPFLQGCAEFGAHHPNPEIYCYPLLRVADINSILISVRAPVGQTNWSDQRYCIGRGLGAIKAKAGFANTLFLKYALNQNMQFLHRRSQGSTFLAIGTNDLKIFPIPDFSEKIQNKIASILQTIDQAIEKTEALIHKYQQIKAGLVHDLFSRGLTADGKLRPPREQAPELYQETPIGWIPKEWAFGPLNAYAEIHNNLRFPLSSEVRDSMEGEFPYYGPTGIIDFINEYRLDGEFTLIGEDGDHFLKTDRMEMTQLVSGKFNVNNHAHILSGKNGCSTEWLFIYYLHRDITYWLTRQGAGRYKLNKAALEKLPLCIPRPKEQALIITRILHLRDTESIYSVELEKLEKQKSGLMHDLLTGKVQVTIDQAESAHG